MSVTFRRALGTFDTTMVVVGGIIGAGIFVNPHVVAERVTGGTGVLVAWVSGGVLALLGALAYSELGATQTRAGGQYVYLSESWHPLVGFLYGWALLTIIQAGGIAAVSLAFAEHLLRALGRAAGGVQILAIAGILVVSAVNWIGVRAGSRLLNALVILKIAALGALVVVGLTLPPSTPGVESASAARGGGVLAFGAAMVPVLFAYGGWQNANYVAAEIKDAARILPRALLIGTSVVVLVYVSVNVAFLRALGHDGLAMTATPTAATLGARFGPAGDRLAALAIAVSTFGFLNLAVLAPTRVYWAMADDGLFPRSLAKLDPRFRTPTMAIAAQSAWAIVLASTGTYGQLLDYVIFGDWIFFGLTVAAIFVVRRSRRDGDLSSSAPGRFADPTYPWGPTIFVISAAFVVVSVIASAPRQAAIGAALLATGVPVYFAFARRIP